MKERLVRKLMPSPARARHAEYSMIYSADDEVATTNDALVRVALDAVKAALETDLTDLSARLPALPDYFNVWPGEHYRLLAGLVKTLEPRRVVEIGTGAALGSLTIKKFLAPDASLATFDIIPWQEYSGTLLRPADFEDGKLTQVIGDWNDPAFADAHRETIASAELIFLDAAKDGILERRVLDTLGRIAFKQKVILLLDDIRVWNMLAIWRSIDRPKLDLTSFGHWSGTGLVEWR